MTALAEGEWGCTKHRRIPKDQGDWKERVPNLPSQCEELTNFSDTFCGMFHILHAVLPFGIKSFRDAHFYLHLRSFACCSSFLLAVENRK